MSDLTPEVKQAIAEANKKILDQPRDLRELIEQDKLKNAEKPNDSEEPKDQKPEKPAEKETKISKEDLSRVTDLFSDRLGFRKEKVEEGTPEQKAKAEADEKAKSEAEAKSKAEAEKSEEQKNEKEKEQKKVAVRKKVDKPEIDTTELATNVAIKAAKEVANELRKKEEVVAEPDIDLSEEEKSELEVFKEMAKSNPSYKDLPKKYVDSIKKIEDYKTKWESSNPDKQFDPNDDEHDTFYARVTPAFNERDFRQAEIRREASNLLKEQEKKTGAEQASFKTELAQKELEPVIIQNKIEAAAKVLETINPEYLKMVGEDKDGFKKFQEADPIAAQALMISAHRLGPFIEAARQIDEPKARIKVDTNNPAHMEYINYLIAKEDEMKSKPVREQTDEKGRRFATRQEVIKMNPADRSRYWFFRDNDLIAMKVEEEAENAKEIVKNENERLEKIAKLRGWKIDSAQKTTQSKEEKKTEQKVDKAENSSKIESPSANSGGKVDDTDPNAKKGDGDFLDKSASILFRR